MNQDVRWYIRSCRECQLRQTEYFFIPPIIVDIPSLFRKVHIDTFLMPLGLDHTDMSFMQDVFLPPTLKVVL